MAGLSSPVIRDVVTVRKFVHRVVATEVVVSFEFLKFVLDKKLRPSDCRFHDMVCIVERIAWCLDVKVHYHYHYTQLSPLEYLSAVQTAWLERFGQHHAARRLSSSRRRAEGFALTTKLEDDDLEMKWRMTCGSRMSWNAWGGPSTVWTKTPPTKQCFESNVSRAGLDAGLGQSSRYCAQGHSPSSS